MCLILHFSVRWESIKTVNQVHYSLLFVKNVFIILPNYCVSMSLEN